ncbi:MBL fold metallo-hydrolase [Chloroflexota bacterium]
MKVKWLGHASFLLTSDSGIKIITDPYDPCATGGALKYEEINEKADIVTVSHGHSDHNNAMAIRGNPKIVKGTIEIHGINIKGIPTYHDDAQGSIRGNNTIFCFNIDDVKFCHLGDLGHALSTKQVVDIGEVDVLFIPIGGFYTIDATVASHVRDQLEPRVTIPMHFKNNKCDYPITGEVEFLYGKQEVNKIDTSEIEFAPSTLPAIPQIIVLEPAL